MRFVGELYPLKVGTLPFFAWFGSGLIVFLTVLEKVCLKRRSDIMQLLAYPTVICPPGNFPSFVFPNCSGPSN